MEVADHRTAQRAANAAEDERAFVRQRNAVYRRFGDAENPAPMAEADSARSLASRVRITPSVAPTCPITAGSSSGTMVSRPSTLRLLIINGTNPQCRPKITHTCHIAPIKAPAMIGLKA